MSKFLEFKCPHCGDIKAPVFLTDTPVFTPCSCQASMVEIERNHRAEIEKRKQHSTRQRRDRRK